MHVAQAGWLDILGSVRAAEGPPKRGPVDQDVLTYSGLFKPGYATVAGRWELVYSNTWQRLNWHCQICTEMLYLLFNQISLDENNFILGPQKVQHHGKKASTTRAQANKQTGSLTKGRKDIGTDTANSQANSQTEGSEKLSQHSQLRLRVSFESQVRVALGNRKVCHVCVWV